MVKTGVVGIAATIAAVLLAVPANAQSAAQATTANDGPKEAIYITDAQVKTVLKNAPPAVDQQLRIVDMGEYQLAVGVIHRGPTGGARGGAGRGAAAGAPGGARGGGAAGGGGGRGAAGGAPPTPCGATATPGAKPSGVTGIAHDATTETYVITSGAGTLVTGGTIVNGRRSAPGTQVTDILNGPSCSGAIEGTIVRQAVKTGDIIIIPAGVPHGWTDIADHVTYLSVRPDPDEVLQKGYVHPDIK